MKSKSIIPIVVCVLIQWTGLYAFSPYENFLQSDQPKQVGLIAMVDPDKAGELKATLARLQKEPAGEVFKQVGISNLTGFTRSVGKNEWIVLHFVLDGEMNYLEAAALFEGACQGTHKLTKAVIPHPLAARQGTTWLQMEWINYIRGKEVPGPAASELMIVTTVIPEKEAEYRSLHQTVWPGVVDALVRSNNRDLCIFLTEIDELLVEFLYVEYVGDDQDADDALSQSDPINKRWWNLTDACQKGIPGVDGNWVLMLPLQ